MNKQHRFLVEEVEKMNDSFADIVPMGEEILPFEFKTNGCVSVIDFIGIGIYDTENYSLDDEKCDKCQEDEQIQRQLNPLEFKTKDCDLCLIRQQQIHDYVLKEVKDIISIFVEWDRIQKESK
jgi:hypothetical protein